MTTRQEHVGTNHKHTQSIKPIFHCNAKPLALGPHIGLVPQREIEKALRIQREP